MVYVFALSICSRVFQRVLRDRVRDCGQMNASESKWQQSSRDGWRDPAIATAVCWLHRTTANAVVTCVSTRAASQSAKAKGLAG